MKHPDGDESAQALPEFLHIDDTLGYTPRLAP